jgi:tetratricopeptide (TPR) repeat protein
MIRKIAVVIFCITFTACLVDTKKVMAEYEKETKLAIMAELIQDWPNAELHYNAALKEAEKIPWNDGIFTAKQKLGDVYSNENKIAEAEKSYVEAKDLCKKELMCKGLDGIYDALVRFYIYYAKTPEKAENVMDDMVTMKARLRSGADLRMRFKGYANDMRTAGFYKEADFLNQYINQMPDR